MIGGMDEDEDVYADEEGPSGAHHRMLGGDDEDVVTLGGPSRPVRPATSASAPALDSGDQKWHDGRPVLAASSSILWASQWTSGQSSDRH